MDPLAAKYFPNEKTADEQIAQSLAYGVRQNPDQYAKDLSTGLVGIQDARARDDAAFNARLQALGISTITPVTKRIYSDPDTAAVAWDDLRGVQAMETLSNQFHYDGLTPSQTQAVLLDRGRVAGANQSKTEVGSIVSNILTGTLGTATKIVGAAVETGLASIEYLDNRFRQKTVKGADGSFYYAPDEAARLQASAILNDTNKSVMASAVREKKEGVLNWLSSGVKAAPSEMLVDPATGKAFRNPDYSMWGRGFGNQLEALPGMMAQFAAGGAVTKFAEFAMGTEAALSGYEQARANGDSMGAALAKGLGIGTLNLGLFRMAGPAGSTAKTMPTEAALDAAAPSKLSVLANSGIAAVKRGVGLGAGMTAGEELIQNVDRLSYWTQTDPMETLKKFASGAANFTAFELAGAIQPVIANIKYMRAMRQQAEDMKLRERSIERFRNVVEQTTEGAEVLLPKEELERFCQTNGLKTAEIISPQAFNIKEQFDKADPSTMLRIKLSDYFAYSAGKSTFAERMDPLLRFNEGDASPVDVQNAMKARFLAEQRWAASVGISSEEPAVPSEDYQKIYTAMKEQLEGIFNEPTADTYAKWHASTLENLGKRFGVKPVELQKKYGFFVDSIRNGMTEERVREDAGKLYQSGEAEAAYAQHPDTAGGSKLDVDIARQLDANYVQDPARVAGIHHEAVSGFINRLYNKRMEMPAKEGEVVHFMAGGGGVGKSTASRELKLTEGVHTVYDGTLANYESSAARIDKALDLQADGTVGSNARTVLISFVGAPFEKALNNVVLRAHEEGRPVGLDALATAHTKAPATLLKLMERYAPLVQQGWVKFQAIENAGGIKDIRLVDPAELTSFLERYASQDVPSILEKAYNDIRENGYVNRKGQREQLQAAYRRVFDKSWDAYRRAREAAWAESGGRVEVGPAESLGQPELEGWGTGRGQLREVRKLLSGLKKDSFSELRAAMRDELGEKEYRKVLKSLTFMGESGDKALRKLYDVAHEKEMPGAPATIRTPEARQDLVDRMVEMAKRGEVGRYWYDESARAFLSLANGDKLKAFKLACLSAIYSPQTSVPDNGRRAILAWYDAQHKMAIEPGGTYPKVKEVATKIMNTNSMEELAALMKTQKVGTFGQNLVNLFAPEHVKDDIATIDVHMMRAFGYDTDAPTPVQYKWAEQIVRDVTQQLGWGSPKEAQAAIWVAQKASTDKTDLTKSGVHYGDAARAISGQINVESKPGDAFLKKLFPGYENATREQVVAYHQEKSNIVREVLRSIGVMITGESTGHGQYGAESNPVTSYAIPLPHIGNIKDRALSEASREELRRAASAVYDLLGDQDSIGWYRPFHSDVIAKKDCNAIHLAFPRELTHEEMLRLVKVFDKANPNAFIDGSDAKNLKVINYAWDPGQANEFRAQMDKVFAEALPDLHPAKHLFAAESGLIDERTKYEWDTPERSSNLETIAIDRGRAKIADLNERFRTEYAWGSAEPLRLRQEGIPAFGEPGEGLSVHGVHYSRAEGLQQLDPSMFGTGAAGREMRRLGSLDKSDPLRSRLNFYVSEDGSLPKKERMVPGQGVYDVTLHNLYDLQNDPLGLKQKAMGDGNELERSIVASGYNGYVNEAPGINGRAAVLLTNQKVGVRELSTGSVYRQGEIAERGDIVFGKDNRISIRLFDKADLSTLVHELSHAYFKVYRDLIKRPDAPASEKETYAKLLDWLGVKSGDTLTRDHLEKLARAEEQWLHEGKAPSVELAKVFGRMSLWMQKVYGKVAAYAGQTDQEGKPLGVTINADVADFFNRLHASDEAVNQMRDFKPMFATAEEMGVPQKIFDAYMKLAGKTIDSAKTELVQKALKQGERRLKSWWRDEEGKVREEVTKKLDATPVMQAVKALQDGEVELPTGGRMEVALSRAALVERYGEDFVKELSAKIQKHISNVGADPDVLAEMFGFPSGERMLQEIMQAPRRSEAIKTATEKEMANRHGDMLLDGTIVDEAMKLLHGEDRGKLIQQELAILKAQQRKASDLEKARIQEQAANLRDVQTLAKEQAQNKEQEQKNIARVKAQVDRQEIKEAMDSLPKLEDVRAKAVADVDSMTLRELKPNQFLSTARRAAKKSMERAMRNDYEGAVAAQQEYLVNHFRYIEAANRRDEVAAQVNELRNLQSKDMQMDLGKAGGTFREQVNSLLERVGLRPVSQTQVEKNQTLVQWADEMLRQGQQPFVAPKLLDEARRINYADMTLRDFRDLHDTVMSIAHVAQQELSIMLGDKKAKFAEAVDEAVNTTAPRKFPDAQHSGGEETTGKLSHFIRSYDAMAIKLAVMVDKLDGRDVNGVWRRAILDPIRNATNEWHRLTEEYVVRMHESLHMPREMRKSLSDKLTLPSGEVINRSQLIGMVLNCGNAENRAMLENKDVNNFSKEDVAFAVQQIRPQEAEYIQGVWDVIETLRPKIGALEKRLNGVEPQWVTSTPIVMAGKEYKGGYFPLVADKTTQTGRRQAPAADQLFEDGYSGVGTVHGFTKDRTGRQYKLDLNWRNITTAHLNAVVKDLAFREAVISVNKFISNDKVRQTVRETMGKEYEDQLTPWLRSIVNEQNGSRLQGTNGVDTFVNKARGHAVNMMIGYKVASTVVQVADFTRVLPMVNTLHLMRGFGEYVSHPFETFDFIKRNSKLMEHRQKNLDRDIRSKLAEMTGDESMKASIQRWGYKGFGLIDRQISSIAWMGAYKEAMAKTGDHDTACRAADRVVELSLQSGEAMDLVALQRNHPITKMFTMFAGDSIAAYNLCRTLGHTVSSPAEAIQFAAGFVLSTAVANFIADYITGRKPPEDEDSKAAWYGWQAVLSPFRMAPIVKDAMSAWEARALGGGGIDYRWSPLLSAMEKTADGIYAQKKYFYDGEEDFDQWLKDSATAAGYLYGVPGGAQAINTTSYLHGVATGDITPEDPVNFMAGTFIGGRK